ncbi:vestitone reductase-like [Abrus precatorius]|uniref:Vestitone reductase-like n=1 Tax=Abrus precatorius TaxID=3816 RepID=A0A8B8LN87_ABRPR|nr:vestitone reductase-like [Abrus precatorius]
MVHVDDLAKAHIFLLEHPNPKGRYTCSSCYVTAEMVSQIASTKYPEFQQKTPDSSKQSQVIKLPDYSSKKLIDLGFVFKYGLEEMLDDAIQCCKEKGIPLKW